MEKQLNTEKLPREAAFFTPDDQLNSPYRIGLMKIRYPIRDRIRKRLVKNIAMNSRIRADGQK